MKTLYEKYTNLFILKNSFLCIGLDPAVLKKKKKNVIMNNQKETKCKKDLNSLRRNFCLNIIRATSQFAIAAKINEQYVKGFTEKDHIQITQECKRNDLISIYDCKLNDISNTAESAIYWIKKWGYDAFTVNVMPGNLKEIIRISHNFTQPLGVIPILLMSNSESKKYFFRAKIGKSPLFLEIAKEVHDYHADGCVIGASNFIKRKTIENILKIIGKDKIILIPGIGTQGGEIKEFASVIKKYTPAKKSLEIQHLKKNHKQQFNSKKMPIPLLINIGRDIIYSNNPSQKAEFYRHKLMSIFNS